MGQVEPLKVRVQMVLPCGSSLVILNCSYTNSFSLDFFLHQISSKTLSLRFYSPESAKYAQYKLHRSQLIYCM